MKKSLIASVLLLSLTAFAGPQETVSNTVGKLMNIIAGTNENKKISQLCALVRSDLDSGAIGNDLLGGVFSKLERDRAGIDAFKKLVPSIIVDQFYDILHDKGGSKWSVGGTVAKGSARVGVRVDIDGSDFVITVLKSSNKIVDVEYRGFSLVKTKGSDFQRDLQDFYRTNRSSSLPVSELVKQLNGRGVNKCG